MSTQPSTGKPEGHAILGVTHSNGHNKEFIRVTETIEGEFIVLTQNNMGASAFTFPKSAPDDVRAALNQLQQAMARANLSGHGGGVNNRLLVEQVVPI